MMLRPSSSVLPIAGSSSAAANPQTSIPEMMEMKRKLDMVTEELSLNRMKQAKKSRPTNASGGQVFIGIPDFPMEYYSVAETARANSGTTSVQNWFENFNINPRIKEQPPAYHQWIRTRVVNMLPQVLTIIGNNLKENRERIKALDLLSCRLVSKSWKQSIDQFLQESFPLEPPIFHEHQKPMNVITCLRSDKYQAIMEMLCLLEKNKQFGTLTPFPSGSLVIRHYDFVETPYQVAFSNAVDTLLEFYGKDLQSFYYFDSQTQANLDITVGRWVKKMPNLKSLDIQAPFRSQSTCLNFPHLPKLITFVSGGTPVSLTEKVLSVNPQIRNLEIAFPDHPQWSKFEQLTLTSLLIRVTSVTQLQSLGILQLPLEKLQLTNYLSRDEMDLGELFKFLEGFEGTLKQLHLYMGVKDNSGSDNWSLRLPHLQHLYLCLRRSACKKKKSYDFLLPLESLEILEIYLAVGEAQREMNDSQVIQLNGYFDKLYESNVWKLFPKLRRVDVMGDIEGNLSYGHFIYTRDKLSERRNRNNQRILLNDNIQN